MYQVILIDRDGCETTRLERDTIVGAKACARYLISDAYARQLETTHAALLTVKAEVRNDRERCLFDCFHPGHLNLTEHASVTDRLVDGGDPYHSRTEPSSGFRLTSRPFTTKAY